MDDPSCPDPTADEASSVCDGPDSDGDGVPDACDNCIEVYNPRLGTLGEPTRAAFQTTSGGQLDDDADGFGNQCDAKFGSGGSVVDGGDLSELRASFNKSRAGTDCGSQQDASCAQFDLDNRGQLIGGTDLTRGRMLFNLAIGPTCDACPLACEGPACP
jgi:hypothetical protein